MHELLSSSEDEQNNLSDFFNFQFGSSSSKKSVKVNTGHISVKPKVKSRRYNKKKS